MSVRLRNFITNRTYLYTPNSHNDITQKQKCSGNVIRIHNLNSRIALIIVMVI